VEYEPRSQRASSVRSSRIVNRGKAFIRHDPRLMSRIIIDERSVNVCTVKEIVTEDSNMRKLCAKMVPKDLNDD
jgi:hypothetical protein